MIVFKENSRISLAAIILVLALLTNFSGHGSLVSAYQQFVPSPLFTVPVVVRQRELTQRCRKMPMPLRSTRPAERLTEVERESGLPVTRKFSKRVLLARVLLGSSVFAAGYRWGHLQASTIQRMAGSSSPRSKSFTILMLTTLVVGLLLRDGWQAIPAWAKPSIIQRAITDTQKLLGMGSNSATPSMELTVDENASTSADFSDLGTLVGKLKGMLGVAERRMPSESLQNFNLQASFFALLSLLQQQKETNARTRDEFYAACGTPISMEDVKGLDVWMDLADAAYNEFPDDPTMSLGTYLDQRGYDLLKHDVTVLPGYLGHYVALNKKEKTAVIGVKGTSSLEDMITDMCGAAVSFDLEDGSFISDGPTTIRAHEGILLSSQRLADDLQPLVEKLLFPQGYQIVIVGHSLGAAAAALLAVLLQSRIPGLRPSPEQSKKLHVYAFASPPNLDLQSASACESFVTTIVNNCDVIPRCNVGPVLVTVELLKVIHERLVRLQQKGDKTESRHLSSLSSAWKYFQQRNIRSKRSSTKVEESMLMTPKELREAIDAALEKVGFNEDDEDQLYVSGTVILMYDLWEAESKYNSKRPSEETKDMGKYDYSADRFVLAKPTAKVLRYLEFDGRMIDDHMAPSYKNSLKSLFKEPQNPEVF